MEIKAGKKRVVYMLWGERYSEKTKSAMNVLDNADIDYKFMKGKDDGFDGPMPQLISGFTTYIGLEAILRFARRAELGKDRSVKT